MSRLSLVCVAAAMVVLINGCMSLNGAPRTRLGAYPTSTVGTPFISAGSLHAHSYGYSILDAGGIAYTCRGGHIDIDHVKIAADYTKYLTEKSSSHLIKGDKDFTFGLNVDPSKYFVQLQYPDDWQNLPTDKKQNISRQVSAELGPYLTFTMVSWHEILTWYGFKTIGFLPEFPSAFSWEDSYSNLIGTRLATRALQDTSLGYDKAMTILLKEELEDLGVQSGKISHDASEKMRGKWFTGIMQPEIKERNMDIGLENGYVTPTLVPGMCADATPQPYPVPKLSVLHQYGFSVNLNVAPGTWEQARIFKAVYPRGNAAKRIKLPDDLPLIIDDMRKEALQLGYHVTPERNQPVKLIQKD